jgi:hypothetical protein
MDVRQKKCAYAKADRYLYSKRGAEQKLTSKHTRPRALVESMMAAVIKCKESLEEASPSACQNIG